MFRHYTSIFFLLAWLLVVQSCAQALSSNEEQKALARYAGLLEDHRKAFCPAGAEEEFNALLKRYRGQGFWVPELMGDIDFVAIEKLLPEMEKKRAWIEEQKKKLAKRRKLAGSKLIQTIREHIKVLLTHKKEWQTGPESERQKVQAASEQRLLQMRTDWKRLIELVPYLTNYVFPVDHLKNRKVHDEFRDRSEPAAIQIANYAALYRRILEDGAYNPDHTGSDSWLRTTLDTVQLEMDRPMVVIDEDLRYDLQFVLNRMEKELERGKDALVARLGEWEERTSKALYFYRDLVNPANRATSRKLIQERNQALLQLKEWVHSRQAKSWLWWSQQDETMKALYTIETILYNEVGDVDTEEALERVDVAQVVHNRRHISFYQQLDPTQELFHWLKQDLPEKKIQSEAWLNVLYRRGEFSFTFYYMLGAVKAFCPDLSATGKRLMRENLAIAWATLKAPRQDFKALRYFSRASMLGRINMASVWEDYQRLPERAGMLVKGQENLRKLMAQGKLTYLYQFQDPQGLGYQVYTDGNKIYGARHIQGQWVFYSWRNPHYFIYFGLKTPTREKL